MVEDFLHEDDRPEAFVARSRVAAEPVRVINRVRHPDGYRTVSWRAVTADDIIYAVGRDVTDEVRTSRELEEAHAALRQSQKMEAVGHLTGGLAHDFNNVLQAINGSLQLIRRLPGNQDKVTRWAEKAIEAVARGASLTSRLLTFSRFQKLDVKAVLLEDLLEQMIDLIERSIGPRVHVELDASEACWHRCHGRSGPTRNRVAQSVHQLPRCHAGRWSHQDRCQAVAQ